MQHQSESEDRSHAAASPPPTDHEVQHAAENDRGYGLQEQDLGDDLRQEVDRQPVVSTDVLVTGRKQTAGKTRRREHSTGSCEVISLVSNPHEEFPLSDEDLSRGGAAEALVHDDEEEKTSPARKSQPSCLTARGTNACQYSLQHYQSGVRLPVLDTTLVKLDVKENSSNKQREDQRYCRLQDRHLDICS